MITQNKKGLVGIEYQVNDLQILLHKFKQLQAKLNQSDIIADTLKFHNEDLTAQLFQKDKIIENLKLENQKNKSLAEDYKAQLLARKKSSDQMIRQLRNQVNRVSQKNMKMCDIVSMLELKLQENQNSLAVNKCGQEGLRKRIEQMSEEISTLKVRLAKSEVEAEKYKLKGLEGQKYWSTKLEQLKDKQKQRIHISKKENDQKFMNELASLRSENYRITKVLKVKEQCIGALEERINQLVTQNNFSQ